MNQIKSIVYWGVIGWPLVVTLVFMRLANWQIHLTETILTEHTITMVWGIGIPTLIFMICLSYTSIMASSVVTDKTSKISELLLAVVGAKEQLIGKILATYALMFLQIGIYGFCLAIYIVTSRSRIIWQFVQKTPPLFVGYVLVDVLVALIMVLVWTTEIASYITDDSQIVLAVIPVMLLITTGTIVAVFLNAPGGLTEVNLAVRVIENFAFAMPPVGSLVIPTLLINHGISYWEALLNLGLEVGVMSIIFRTSVKQYKRGLLSSNKKNPFVRALSHDSAKFKR